MNHVTVLYQFQILLQSSCYEPSSGFVLSCYCYMLQICCDQKQGQAMSISFYCSRGISVWNRCIADIDWIVNEKYWTIVIYHFVDYYFVLVLRQLPKIMNRYSSAEGFLFLQDNTILNYWNLVQGDKNKLWITNKVIGTASFIVIVVSTTFHYPKIIKWFAPTTGLG